MCTGIVTALFSGCGTVAVSRSSWPSYTGSLYESVTTVSVRHNPTCSLRNQSSPESLQVSVRLSGLCIASAKRNTLPPACSASVSATPSVYALSRCTVRLPFSAEVVETMRTMRSIP